MAAEGSRVALGHTMQMGTGPAWTRYGHYDCDCLPGRVRASHLAGNNSDSAVLLYKLFFTIQSMPVYFYNLTRVIIHRLLTSRLHYTCRNLFKICIF